MAIIITIEEHMFRDEFVAAGLMGEFSDEALSALFNWLESYSEKHGRDIELDVRDLSLDWYEYTVAEALESYPDCRKALCDDDDAVDIEAVLEWMNKRTNAIQVGDYSLMIENF